MRLFSRHPDSAPDRRRSSWLEAEQAARPGTEPCETCEGTGASGFVNDKGETIVCETCHGFGY